MFWSSDHLTARRTRNNGNQSFKVNPFSTEMSIYNQEKEAKNIARKDLSQKVQKFISVNKRHQFDEVCVCEDCIYAKQLQRYESLKMDLSKNSSYRAQYNKDILKKNHTKAEGLDESSFSIRPQEGSMSKNPYVHLGSVYRNQYASRSLQKVEKPRPQDGLKFSGPSTSFSSYKRGYSNPNGAYQYVQPMRQQALPSVKFKAQSLYSNEFKATKSVETESGKISDQLRLGKPSMVKQSTSKSQYVNPEIYSLKNQRYNSSIQKKSQAPFFSFQYKTINQDDYEKPNQKKNCRNRRLQYLHGQLLTGQNLSTIE